MILYLGLTVMTVALAYFVDNKATNIQSNRISRQCMLNRVMLGTMFFLLFCVLAFRVDVGNDYGEYLDIFNDLHLGNHVSTEFGFNIVVRIVQFFFGTGVVSARIIFALFAAPTVSFMLRGMHDQSDWFVFSVFLFMANGYYFSAMTSVRYYFVLAIAVYAMKYVLQGKWLPFIAWIVFAACFHKSVLLVIPVYFIASRNWKKWHMLLLVALCVSFLLFEDFYRRIIFTFYPFYENSVFDNGETSLINILKSFAILVFCLLYYKSVVEKDRKIQFWFYLNLGSLVLYTCCSFIPEISRVAYYFNVSNIFLVPAVLFKIPDKKQKIFFGVVIGAAFLAYFVMFLYKAYNVEVGLLPYKTWLFE